MGYGFRHFLFEADGTMRHIPHRVADGLCAGTDYLPRYAGFELRHAHVILETEHKKPKSIVRIEASKWRFDHTGSMRDHMFEGVFEGRSTFEAIGGHASISKTVPADALADRQEWEDKYRWTPGPVEINKMIHAIWPKDAGRPVLAPKAVQGIAKKRIAMTREATSAMYDLHDHLYKINDIIEDLSDQSVKALRQEASDRQQAQSRDAGGGPFAALWGGLVTAADAELTSRARWKSSKGNWFAVVIVWQEVRKGESKGVDTEYRKCNGKKAAIEAARELLTNNAHRFDDGVTVEAEIYPEGEWFPAAL